MLFADDETTLHRLVVALLSTHGYQVECVTNGAEGLRSFRKRHHDAIITDLLMPEMNGYEFLRELRAIDPDAGERTIVLTGASEETWRWFERDGVASFLTKPVDPAVLLAELSRCVSRKKR
ncbi:MAG: response regulator [Acidobacteria bacterium]|nr:response regulator [Acidobacteriota bacterium]